MGIKSSNVKFNYIKFKKGQSVISYVLTNRLSKLTSNYNNDVFFASNYIDSQGNIFHGGYVMNNSGYREGMITKMDTDSNVLKSISINSYSNPNNIIHKIVEDSEGFIYALHREHTGSTYYTSLIKFDKDLIAQQSFIASDTSGRNFFPQGMTIDSNDTIYIVGSLHDGSNYDKPYILKVDNNLNILDNKLIDFSGSSANLFTDVRVLSNGEIVTFGYSRNVQSQYDILICKFDDSLNLLTSKIIEVSGAYNIITEKMDIDSSDNIYMAGRVNSSFSTDYDALICKVDKDLNNLSYKAFNHDDSSYDEFNSVYYNSSNDSVYVVGNMNTSLQDYNAVVFKLNNDLTVQTALEINDSSKNLREEFNSIYMSGTNILISGTTREESNRYFGLNWVLTQDVDTLPSSIGTFDITPLYYVEIPVSLTLSSIVPNTLTATMSVNNNLVTPTTITLSDVVNNTF